MQTTLRLLLGAVAFLLLIACANVANLQLARGTARAREMAVRMSIGAGRRRLLGQLLTESVLLSLIGGVLGVLFAFLAIRSIVGLMPEFYVPNESRVTINLPVLLFSLGVSLLTGILFGLVPAFQASKPDATDALKATLPGVEAATFGLPFGGAQSPLTIPGQAPDESRRITVNLAGADHLRTFGIPLPRRADVRRRRSAARRSRCRDQCGCGEVVARRRESDRLAGAACFPRASSGANVGRHRASSRGSDRRRHWQHPKRRLPRGARRLSSCPIQSSASCSVRWPCGRSVIPISS
jgi:FtsX-like permease family